MRTTLLLLLLLLCAPLCVQAASTATGGTVGHETCDSTTVAVEITPNTGNGVWIANPEGGSVWIWIAAIADCADMTEKAGVPIAPGNAALFNPADGWHGRLCCLLNSAGSVDVTINKF